MGVVENIKDAVALVQKVDNIELYRQMLELQSQVFSLVEENRSLKERLSVRGQVEFKKNAYWLNEQGPYCSRCLDGDGKLVRLHVFDEGYPHCPACNRQAVDPSHRIGV